MKHSKSLVMLDMSSNALESTGLRVLFENGLKPNLSLQYLDLFDVNITDKSIPLLVDALETNRVLYSLRLANTHVGIKFLAMFWEWAK